MVFAGFEISSSEVGNARVLDHRALIGEVRSHGMKITKDALRAVQTVHVTKIDSHSSFPAGSGRPPPVATAHHKMHT